MEREILQQRASELEALINTTEKHDVFQIRVIVDERFDNAIFVMPALEYYDTLSTSTESKHGLSSTNGAPSTPSRPTASPVCDLYIPNRVRTYH